MVVTAHRLVDSLQPGLVAVIGVPSDENSTFMRGPALAPGLIRDALHSGASNLCAENGHDLSTEPRFRDAGDLELNSGAAALRQIEDAVAGLLAADTRVLSLGGDHAITYPILRAYSRRYQELTILHLDAHPDLYDKYDGNPYSHACPFARIMEQKLARRLVQVGIRGMNPHQRSQAERFAVEVHEMRDWQGGFHVHVEGPLYVSLDMDVLDPAFAPGVSHHEPGGLSTREVIRLIQSVHGPIVGADIVELNPKRDPLGTTAAAAAKLLKELAARMLEPGAAEYGEQ
jgi:arginase